MYRKIKDSLKENLKKALLHLTQKQRKSRGKEKQRDENQKKKFPCC